MESPRVGDQNFIVMGSRFAGDLETKEKNLQMPAPTYESRDKAPVQLLRCNFAMLSNHLVI